MSDPSVKRVGLYANSLRNFHHAQVLILKKKAPI